MFRTAALIGAAIAVIGTTAPASAGPPASGATDFSSQQQQQKKKVAPVTRTQPQNVQRNINVNRNVNRNVNINRNVNVNRNVNRNINVNRKVGGPAGGQQLKKVGAPGGPGGAQQLKKVGGPGGPGGAQQLKKIGGPTGPGGAQQLKKVGGPVQKFVPLKPGPGQVVKVKPGNFQAVKLGNKVAPVWKGGPKKIWWGGGWKTFVPLAAIGAVVIGGSYYYADSYLTVGRPYCEGFTPDGCRLNWQRIDFEDGGSEWQCVQYCRRVGAPPPPRTVALVAPPPLPQGGACEIAIFSEPGFGGTNATSSDEQPFLSELGWQNQIASVQVKAGTWDFFSDPEFTGETMRLAPGDYPDLGPQWTKRAGSFMCVQP